jgi:hypothetical protein
MACSKNVLNSWASLITIKFHLPSIMWCLLQQSMVFCSVSNQWLENIKRDLLAWTPIFSKVYFGEIITSIKALENFQELHLLHLNKEKELLYNLYFNRFIKFLLIQLARIDRIYRSFLQTILKLLFILINICSTLKH